MEIFVKDFSGTTCVLDLGFLNLVQTSGMTGRTVY